MSAQCPTPKGKGKGTKGNWKGGGKGWGGKSPYKGKTGVRPVEGEEETNDGGGQEVNAFTKGKGKGGKGWYRYQVMWNDKPGGGGYQGVCWRCGEVGHQQRECSKTIQNLDCGNIECDFFFGAVEAEKVEDPPILDFERTFRRTRRGVKFGGYGGECRGGCSLDCYETGNKFAELSVGEKGNEDGDDEMTTRGGARKEVEERENIGARSSG